MLRSVLFATFIITLAGTASAQEGEVIDRSGVVRFVYVAPEGLKDKDFVAQVLHAIMRKEIGLDRKTDRWRGIVQIMLFDNKRYTPRGFPMTDKQMIHYRARYNYNSNTNSEEFVWVSLTDAKVSPPKLKETKDGIRPGFVP